MALAEFLSLLAERWPDASARGAHFERYLRDALRVSPSHQFVNVWLWDEWPGRVGPDLGIDLVAEHVDGGLWGIQSKLYAPDASLTWKELSTWVAATRGEPWTQRLLVSTTSHLSANAQRQLLSDPKTLMLLGEDLFSLPVQWPDSLEGPIEQVAPMVPRPHQVEAINAICAGFDDGAARLQAHMACGTGKTLVGLRVYEQIAPEVAVCLVPSLSLMAQTIRSWAANALGEFRYLPVCSDVKVAEDERRGEDADLDVDDLAVLDSRATTDADDIAEFLRGTGPRVVFCTYQSSEVLAAAARNAGIRFGLVVADEAHRTTGAASSVFSTVLHDDAFPAVRRLFVTATPRLFAASDGDDETVLSMDNGDVYGEVVYELGFGHAVDLGLLADYEVVVVAVEDPQLRSRILDGGYLELEGMKRRIDASALVALEGSLRAIDEFGMSRLISFHSRIRRAKDFAAAVPVFQRWRQHHTTVEADTVNGTMNAPERKQRISWLEHGEHPRVLTNARCLTEGIDVPSLDGIVFADPRRSQIDIVQAVGRVMRTDPDDDDKVGRIIVPIVVPDPDDVDGDNVFEDSAFKPVWDVIRALKAHDFRLESELNRLRGLTAIGPINQREFRQATHLNVIGVGDVESFQLAVINRSTPNFWWYVEGPLAQYVAREEHANVPAKHVEPFGGADIRLGGWVNACRTDYSRGALPAERVAALDAMQGWTWDAREALFQNSLTALRRFVEENGSVRVPPDFIEIVDGKPIRLAMWASGRRNDYNEHRLSAEHQAALEAIPGWTWDVRQSQFDRHVSAIRDYAERTGNARLSDGYVEKVDGVTLKLGRWAIKRRAAYQRGKLPQEQIAALEAITVWEWDPYEADFKRGLAALRKYAKREGHARVPQKHIEPLDGEDFPLGGWASGRRVEYRKGTLPPERATALRAVPGWEWDTSSERSMSAYRRNIAAYHKYFSREGHGHPPTNHFEEVDGERIGLGKWLAKRRSDYRRGKLSDQKIGVLEALPGWEWEKPRMPTMHTRTPIPKRGDDRFRRNLEALYSYVEREGHARVPQPHVEHLNGADIALGRWVTKRRGDYRRGRLLPDRIAGLQDVPGWEWDPHEDDFQHGLAALRQYYLTHGDAHVPQKHVETIDGEEFHLGAWATARRSEQRKGKLARERAAALEAMPGWEWQPRSGPRGGRVKLTSLQSGGAS